MCAALAKECLRDLSFPAPLRLVGKLLFKEVGLLGKGGRRRGEREIWTNGQTGMEEEGETDKLRRERGRERRGTDGLGIGVSLPTCGKAVFRSDW